jgi:hypothetical protein
MKHISFILILILATSGLSAQHEISVAGGGGLSTLNFDNRKAGFGGTFGLGYLYRFNEKIGIRSGVDMAFYSAKLSGNLTETYVLDNKWHNTPNDHQFLYSAEIEGIEEISKATYLQIPVMLQYTNKKFYAAGGLKLGFRMSDSYQTTIKTLTTTGYSEYSHQTYENVSSLGFSTFQNFKDDGHLNLNFGVFLALETGVMWQLSGKTKLYTGLYFDHSLNNLSSGNVANPHTEYTGISTPKVNTASSLSDKIGATAVGVVLRFSLNLQAEGRQEKNWNTEIWQ